MISSIDTAKNVQISPSVDHKVTRTRWGHKLSGVGIPVFQIHFIVTNISCQVKINLNSLKALGMSFSYGADLLSWDWLSRCWEEPNNRCCSHTGLCDEGLMRRRAEEDMKNLGNFNLRHTFIRKSVLGSHRSSSCRWIFFDLLRCSRGGRGWTSQTVGRDTSGSPYLGGNKKKKKQTKQSGTC